MSEEIKIITLGDIFKNIETEEKAFKFKDYIINLQQENKQLKAKSDVLEENNKLLIQQKAQMYEDLDIAYEKIDKAIENIKTIKQHYEELKKAPFEDSVFINDMLRQSFILSIESYLDLFLEILGEKENE